MYEIFEEVGKLTAAVTAEANRKKVNNVAVVDAVCDGLSDVKMKRQPGLAHGWGIALAQRPELFEAAFDRYDVHDRGYLFGWASLVFGLVMAKGEHSREPVIEQLRWFGVEKNIRALRVHELTAMCLVNYIDANVMRWGGMMRAVEVDVRAAWQVKRAASTAYHMTTGMDEADVGYDVGAGAYLHAWK